MFKVGALKYVYFTDVDVDVKQQMLNDVEPCEIWSDFVFTREFHEHSITLI